MFHYQRALLQHVLEGLNNQKLKAGGLSGKKWFLTLTLVVTGTVFRLKDTLLTALFMLLTALYLVVSKTDSSTIFLKY